MFAVPRAQGVLPGALHPFQAVASLDSGVPSLPGTTFGIEADGVMREVLVMMALALGGRPLILSAADKALYHLSAVMMGNLLTGLAATVGILHPEANDRLDINTLLGNDIVNAGGLAAGALQLFVDGLPFP